MGIVDINKWKTKALALNAVVGFAAYFVYDMPQVLASGLIRSLSLTTTQVGLLYSAYALPNLVLAPISGFIIEKYGIVRSTTAFTILMLIGQLIIFYGVANKSYYSILTGRGIYGIGGEGFLILQPTVNEYWFSGSFLTISNGLCQSANFLIVILGNYSMPIVHIMTRSLVMPNMLGVLSAIVSLALGMIYVKFHMQHKDKRETNTVAQDDDSLNNTFDIDVQDTRAEKQKDEKTTGFKVISQFSAKYWLLCGVYMVMANCYYQFTNIATDMITNRFGYSLKDAEKLNILPNLMIVIGTPLLSVFLQVQGKKAVAIMIGAWIYFFGYLLLFSLASEKSYFVNIGLVSIGVGYAILLSSAHSCVALIVPQHGLSMAYALMVFFETCGLTLLPLWVSYLSESRTKVAYNSCLILLTMFSVIAIIISSILVLVDFRSNCLLDLPENSKYAKSILKKSSNFSQVNPNPNTSLSNIELGSDLSPETPSHTNIPDSAN